MESGGVKLPPMGEMREALRQHGRQVSEETSPSVVLGLYRNLLSREIAADGAAAEALIKSPRQGRKKPSGGVDILT